MNLENLSVALKARIEIKKNVHLWESDLHWSQIINTFNLISFIGQITIGGVKYGGLDRTCSSFSNISTDCLCNAEFP